MTTFAKRSRIDASTEELFAWHRRPVALPAAGFEYALTDFEHVLRRTLGRPV